MQKKSFLCLFLFVLFINANAIAGPFGLKKGMSLNEIGGQPKKLGNGVYKLTKVPKPHSAFEFYVVRVSTKEGLCFIKAVGKDISTNRYGVSLESEFELIEKKLEANYGKYEKIDFLLTGSIWDEPEDWMMGLLKQERVLLALWENEKGSSLPSDIKEIGLYAVAESTEKGYLAIEYNFINFDSCKSELAAQEDDSL